MTGYIGLRNIKTGIAVTLCIIVARFIDLDSAFFASIAAIIIMGKTVGSSYALGKSRIIGTILGAIIGLICVTISPGNAVACGLGIILLITICNRLGIQNSINVGGFVLVAIMINLNGRHPVVYSLNRLYDTCIGILIALGVNALIFPHNSEKVILKNYEALCKYSREGLSILEEKCIHQKVKDMKTSLSILEEYLQVYKTEWHTKNKVKGMCTLESKIELLKCMIRHMEIVNELLEKYIVDKGSENEFDNVYSYHIKKIKEINEQL